MCVQSFPPCLGHSKPSVSTGVVIFNIVKRLLAFLLPRAVNCSGIHRFFLVRELSALLNESLLFPILWPRALDAGWRMAGGVEQD